MLTFERMFLTMFYSDRRYRSIAFASMRTDVCRSRDMQWSLCCQLRFNPPMCSLLVTQRFMIFLFLEDNFCARARQNAPL